MPTELTGLKVPGHVTPPVSAKVQSITWREGMQQGDHMESEEARLQGAAPQRPDNPPEAPASAKSLQFNTTVLGIKVSAHKPLGSALSSQLNHSNQKKSPAGGRDVTDMISHEGRF